MEYEALFQGQRLQRIDGVAVDVGRAENGDDVVLAAQQLFRYGLSKGLLAVDDYAHL
jgi:hypothetical protein